MSEPESQTPAAAPMVAGLPAQPYLQPVPTTQPVPTVDEVQSSVVQERRRWRDRAGKVGTGTVVAGGAAAKLAGKAALLGKATFVLAKFKTLGSMLVSVGAYALFWGWKFAVGFVLLMLVHEMGHVVVLKAQGVKASAPMFIPFMGAFVAIKGPQRSVGQEAASALAGPVFGFLGSAAVWGVGYSTGSGLLQALAYSGFLLNLFNLFPVLPLDGGRVAGALHPAVWIVGIIGAVGLLVWHPTPVAIVILIMGGMETWNRWRARKAGKTNEYFSIPSSMRWAIGLAYAATAIFLLVGMDLAYVPRPL
jgi:Zn-dependent protease